MTFDIDDPRLTAFALGELDGAENQEIERLLAEHPEARKLVDEIRLTASWLSEQLHEEQAREAAPPAVVVAPPAEAPAPRLVGADSSPKPRPWWRSPTILSSIAATMMIGTSLALLPTVRSRREALDRAKVAADFEASAPALGWRVPPDSAALAPRGEMASDALSAPAAASPAPSAARSTSAFIAGDRDFKNDAQPRKAKRGRLDLGVADRPAAASAPRDLSLTESAPVAAAPAAPPAPAANGPQSSARSEMTARANLQLRSQPEAGQAGGGPQLGRPLQSGSTDHYGMGGAMGGMAARSIQGQQEQGLGNDKRGQGSRPGRQDQGPVEAERRGGLEEAAQQFGRKSVDRNRSDPASANLTAGLEAAAKPVKEEAGTMLARGGEPSRPFGDAEAAPPAPSGDAGALKETELGLSLAKDGAPALRQQVEERLFDQADGPQQPPAAEPAAVAENPFVLVGQEAVSTFSIDVDTASYSIVRRSLMQQNGLPAPEEVRIEEMLNYFPYQDPSPPATSPDPFAIRVEVARCPWNADNRLARIGIAGKPIAQDSRKPSNLVFLVDVSGSMDQPNKLPLVQWGLQRLVEQLGENDRVAIVVYAGSSGLVLPSTSCLKKAEILARIEELRAGGSTNGGAGIQLAYDLASANFINEGINRVILATDGDFNVGVTNQDELVRLVESRAKGPKPVFLSVLGFGMDNLKDGTLEKLADKGNGHYAYIDGPDEAHKVLVEEMGATLDVIAKDVKIQVEFKPEQVKAYRLVGYENRVMANEDFANDQKDAGEIGAGHHVTALYEIVPAGGEDRPADGALADSFVVRLRYKKPEGDVSALIERPVADRGLDYSEASDDFKFASSVAGFGMLLRRSPSVGTLTYAGVIELASPTLAHDPSGYRKEFLGLVQKARDLSEPPLAAPAQP